MLRTTRSFLLLLLAVPLLGSLFDCAEDEKSGSCSDGLDGTYTLWLEGSSGDFNCTGIETRTGVVIAGGTITFDGTIGSFGIAGDTGGATWTESWTGGGVTTNGTFTITVDPVSCTVNGSGAFSKDFTGGSSCSGSMSITGEKIS